MDPTYEFVKRCTSFAIFATVAVLAYVLVLGGSDIAVGTVLPEPEEGRVGFNASLTAVSAAVEVFFAFAAGIAAWAFGKFCWVTSWAVGHIMPMVDLVVGMKSPNSNPAVHTLHSSTNVGAGNHAVVFDQIGDQSERARQYEIDKDAIALSAFSGDVIGVVRTANKIYGSDFMPYTFHVDALPEEAEDVQPVSEPATEPTTEPTTEPATESTTVHVEPTESS